MMCVNNTPVEFYPEYNLWVKREDLCCPSGPHFSKTRGVYAHIAKRPETTIGVLDTSHSQGGWATAQACKLLGKKCRVYYPQRKAEMFADLKPQQAAARALGATLVVLPAGRSAILYHRARHNLSFQSDSYMMPNALKLPEMIEETIAEVERMTNLTRFKTIIISASSGTIAAGVITGFQRLGYAEKFYVHLGYSRSKDAVINYMLKISPAMYHSASIEIIDEGYAYADKARPGTTPPFPCNPYYDLKAFRWWVSQDRGEALLWNVG